MSACVWVAELQHRHENDHGSFGKGDNGAPLLKLNGVGMAGLVFDGKMGTVSLQALTGALTGVAVAAAMAGVEPSLSASVC